MELKKCDCLFSDQRVVKGGSKERRDERAERGGESAGVSDPRTGKESGGRQASVADEYGRRRLITVWA